MAMFKFRKLPVAWGDLPLRLKGLVVVAIPLSALIFSLIASLLVERRRENLRLWVEHTMIVRAKIADVLAGVTEAETGVRGFLLTGREDFLAPYRAAQKELPETIVQLLLLVQDNLPQVQRVQRIQAGTAERVAALNRVMQPAFSGTKWSSDPSLIVQGKARMDALRTLIHAADHEEGRLLDVRTARMNQIEKWVWTADLTSIGLGILGGLLAIQLFSSGIVHRVQRLEENTIRLSEELPLLPLKTGKDEIGSLAHGLERASHLLSERRKALYEEAERFRLLVEGVKDYAIFMLDPSGRVVSWNAGAQRIKGYRAEEIIGEHFSRFYTAEDLAAGKPPRELAVATAEGCYEEEGWRLRKDGGRFWASVLITAVRDEAGLLRGFSKVTRDITARKLADEALRAAKDEAERANAAKDEFLSRISHELRTPLNAILGFAQLLELGTLGPRQKNEVEHIIKGGRHLLGLVNEVLDVTSIETGRMSLSPEPVRINKLLESVWELVRPLAQCRNITLVKSYAGCADLYVLADQQRLQQVLFNLLSNAIKYNHDGGRVTLACAATSRDGKLTITVSDTGGGIGTQNMSRLFTPFDRLGAESTTVPGTGLGLALSKRLVELMDGRIGAQSELGQGSTFWVELPEVAGPLEHLDSSHYDASISSVATDERVSCTLLYIEDNVSNLTLIEHLLEHRPGITLLSAMQGGGGLELAREHEPDIIFLDLHLPDLNGDEVLARLRSDRRTADIPVVMISADATAKQIERLLAAGAYTYLTKPIDVQEFFRILDELSPSFNAGAEMARPPMLALQ